MNLDQIHVLTKKALKGDVQSLLKLFDFLEKYNTPIAKYASYAILYQYVMNNILDLGKYCKECGGKCCKAGLPIPIYNFDYKELKNRLSKDKLGNFKKVNGFYILQRPCPFQKDWICEIHAIKPYACLSFPFATEDEQKEVIESYSDGVPNFKVPEYCIAGKKVKEFMEEKVKELRERLNRDPTARELLQYIKS